jgi:hypothetical protein
MLSREAKTIEERQKFVKIFNDSIRAKYANRVTISSDEVLGKGTSSNEKAH